MKAYENETPKTLTWPHRNWYRNSTPEVKKILLMFTNF